MTDAQIYAVLTSLVVAVQDLANEVRLLRLTSSLNRHEPVRSNSPEPEYTENPFGVCEPASRDPKAPPWSSDVHHQQDNSAGDNSRAPGVNSNGVLGRDSYY